MNNFPSLMHRLHQPPTLVVQKVSSTHLQQHGKSRIRTYAPFGYVRTHLYQRTPLIDSLLSHTSNLSHLFFPYSGKSGIRTHGAIQPYGLVDRRFMTTQPPYHLGLSPLLIMQKSFSAILVLHTRNAVYL